MFFRELGQGLPLIAVHGWTLDYRHMVGALEQAGLFQALVTEWLDRVEEYVGVLAPNRVREEAPL